jgi:hypothetical protein
MGRVTCEQMLLSDADVWGGCSVEAVLRKEGKTVAFDGKADPNRFKKAARAHN